MIRARRRLTLALAALVFLAVTAWGLVRDVRPAPVATEVAVIAPVTGTDLEELPFPRPRRARMARIRAAASSSADAPPASGHEVSRIPSDRTPTIFRRGPTVRADAVPRSVQVLRIPVPALLPMRAEVRWALHPGDQAEVLSTPRGTLPVGSTEDSRAITVVTRIPAQAPAGPLTVGEAEFIEDSVSVTVQVELTVARIRRMAVHPARSATAAVAGQKLPLVVEVRNLGNSMDTARVTGAFPAGWGTARELMVPLLPGERKTLTLETHVPSSLGTTAAFPRVNVYAGTSLAASTAVGVQVQDPTEGRRPAGPQLVVGLATAAGDSAPSSPALDFVLSGQIRPTVSILGRAGLAMNDATVDRRALAQVGSYFGGAFLTLRGPGWYGTLGTTGASLSPLTGTGSYGRGLSGGATRGSLTMSGLLTDVPNGGGLQTGGRADYRFDRGAVGVAVAHFADHGLTSREVTSGSLIGAAQLGGGFQAKGEVGWRAFDGGSGAGFALGVERYTNRDLVSAHVTRAPGGSRAFGIATTEWGANAARRLNEWIAIQGSAFNSEDLPPGGTDRYRASGWHLGPRVAITRELTAEVNAQRSSFTSHTGSLELGSTDQAFGAMLRHSGRHYDWSLGGTFGQSERTTAVGATTPATFTARSYGLSAGASTVIPRATLSAGVDYSRSGAGVGQAPRQLRLSVAAANISLFSNERAPRLLAEADWTSWLGDRKSVLVTRIGAEAQLPADLMLTAQAEHNPYFHPGAGHTPWVLALRISRGFTLGWAARSAMTRGLVYQDLNGNGTRDPDERGLAGVLVRRGSQSAVTDGSGRFGLLGKDGAPTEVDPTTLPAGMVAPARTKPSTGQGLALPVVPTGAITIRLVPMPDALGRRPERPLDLLAVVARDEVGAEWYLRADSVGEVRFDALPPGHYTFTADFAGTPERLRQLGPPMIIDIHPGMNLPPREIPFGVRPLRIFNGGTGQADQGRQRR
jgi:hypothetical protein